MDKTLLARVAALPNMPLSDLKALWRDVYQDEPPGIKVTLNADWLIARRSLHIADPQIENRIEQQADDLFGSGKKAKPKRKT